MHKTYEGHLHGDRVEWTEEAPDDANGARVLVTVVKRSTEDETNDGEEENLKKQSRKAVEAMRRIAERGGIPSIEDPSEWQRRIRKDRPLPGREDDE